MFEITESNSEVLDLGSLNGAEEVRFARGVKAKVFDRGNAGESSKKVFHFGEDVDVEFLKIVDAGEESGDENLLEVNLERGAKVKTTVVCLGNNNSKLEVRGHVHDSNASCDVNVIYFADSPEKFFLRVRNDFYKKDSCGGITVRGIAARKANIEIFGEIGIAQAAGGTDSRLDQHALIWGKGSKVRQLPILEINTNDVKAGHGATVSRIQDEELFYFLSRGIAKDVAYSLCVNGFLSALVEEISNFEDHYTEVLAAIAERTQSLVEAQ